MLHIVYQQPATNFYGLYFVKKPILPGDLMPDGHRYTQVSNVQKKPSADLKLVMNKRTGTVTVIS